jgi:hypothetical protein
MDYLRLTIAVCLPWLGGYLWLAFLESRCRDHRPHPLRQVGYGLFIGYAGLQGIVLATDGANGAVEFWRIASVLTLLTAAGGLLLLRARLLTGATTPPAADLYSDDPRFVRILFWLLLCWATLHLVFAAIEILHRPVFPWDAWLNWIYRAKAWYFNGAILPMDNPQEWLLGTGTARYNVPGNSYPTFVPVLALWCASALGYWSETLVNLPVLLCGIALGLGMYGQCREFGLPRWQAALAAYLLLSIPLLGVHLALAGMADIWMVGFTGLGFVALLHGLILERRCQVVLGLGVVALGTGVKVEGLVWLLGALAVTALSLRPRQTLIGLALAGGAAALAWLGGLGSMEIPLLGRIGFEGGRVHIPLLGSYALQSFELWDDYLDNFFKSGSWHLLWSLLLLSAIGLLLVPPGRRRTVILVFYCVVAATQLFIFQSTEQGQWAEDWTAINRLPLHFAPGLVFALVVLARSLFEPGMDGGSNRLYPWISAIGLLIALAGSLTYLLTAYPGGNASTLALKAEDMRIVVGEGRRVDDVRMIEGYKNNIALLSSGPVAIDTSRLSLLRVDTRGANRKHATFFWRNGAGPDDLHSTSVSGRGVRWLNLDSLPEWSGEVRELGIVFYADDGRSVGFRALRIEPHSLAGHLGKLWHDWSELTPLSQKSVNWLPAGAAESTLPLPVLLAAWVVASMLITGLTAHKSTAAVAGAMATALLAWALLDIRWTANRFFQASTTIRDYPLISADYLEFGDDRYTKQLVDHARPTIQQDYKRTVIAAEDQDMAFQVKRAKYHALPAAVYVHEGKLESVPVRIADYLLLLKKRYSQSGQQLSVDELFAPELQKKQGERPRLVWEDENGLLYSIATASAAQDGGP